jgi:hypothetical protein
MGGDPCIAYHFDGRTPIAICREVKRPPNPDGLSIGATRSEQAAKISERSWASGTRRSLRDAALVEYSTRRAMTARGPAS